MLGLRTTIYKVSDLLRAKEWYTKVFQIEPYFENEFYVGFNVKGYELGIMKADNELNKTDNVLSYWGVDNINEKFDFFLKSGALAHEKPVDVGEAILVASVKDPWNNVIGLIYNPLFKLPE